ncbi:TetR family transcriptional regulator [Kibdelosporangium philippinense]|uniref:TetR family transcriptional regulator n=1 Tax=Kibdelosporangium philippinense TaxID=211113 RepID=A0ABS8ZCL7_9PSEU|nr:TetR family transcriptional regulator [Kibdelosporangium philippinense]MCE7004421.1 TetR family transcriptional regulator [Kibdelosporangium philippinense]
MTDEEARPRRMRREERREQILDAATRAFATEGGFASTSLDDVAAESGVTRMILYRHFDSKTDLYEAVLERAALRMHAATTVGGELGEHSVPGMLKWASADPAGFRLLFHYAAKEPEFSKDFTEIRQAMVAALLPHMEETAVSKPWAAWAANLATTMVIEAIMAWLDAGRPDEDQAVDRIARALDGIYQAATENVS